MFSSDPFADPIISAPYLYVHYIVTKVNNNMNQRACAMLILLKLGKIQPLALAGPFLWLLF